MTKTSSLPAAPLAPAVHVVEDDEDVRIATARLLKIAGYKVQTYASASEFLGRMPPADTDSRREAEQLGCVAYLRKPFHGRALVALLRTLVRERQSAT